MTDPFILAIAFTLQHEGKTSMDRSDPGNWTGGKVGKGELRGTKYGISAAEYPLVDIQALTLEEARRLYRIHYWMHPHIDQVAGVAPDLGTRLFDLGVNCGPPTAIRMLQRAVNTVCAGDVPPQRAAAWRQKIARLLKRGPLRVDGLIGPITVSVIAACPYKGALLAALRGEAYDHYRAGNPLYIPGWLERLGA